MKIKINYFKTHFIKKKKKNLSEFVSLHLNWGEGSVIIYPRSEENSRNGSLVKLVPLLVCSWNIRAKAVYKFFLNMRRLYRTFHERKRGSNNHHYLVASWGWKSQYPQSSFKKCVPLESHKQAERPEKPFHCVLCHRQYSSSENTN